MQELGTESKVENSELLKEANALKPTFASKDEALKHYKNKLEAFSGKYNKSIDKLIGLAESEVNFNEDFLEVLTLVRKIEMLQR